MERQLSIICITIFVVGLSFLPITVGSSLGKQELSQSLYSIGENSGISLITVQVTEELGLNDWYISDMDFDINYESEEIAKIYYGINGEWILYNKPFTISDDGAHILEWYAVDFEGNQSDVDGPISFKIDQTPPDIDLVYEVYNYYPGFGWEILYTATATDETSGMERVKFYVDDILKDTVYGPGPYYEWTFWLIQNPFRNNIPIVKSVGYDKAGNSAETAIYYPSTSMVNIGNTKSLKSSYIKSGLLSFQVPDEISIDKLNYDSSMVGIFDPLYVVVFFDRRLGNNVWCVDDVTFSFIPDSDGIIAVYYKLDDGDWTLYSEPVDISDDGAHNYSWYVVDSEGNTSTPDSIDFKIDMTPPEINLRKERLSKNKIKFIADVDDEMSGIEKVYFIVDGSLVCTDYDYPYEWNWTGWRNEKVEARAFDNAGNRASDSTGTLFNINLNRQNINLKLSSSSFFFPMLERLFNLLIIE
jgi:hypothetical protein